MALAPVGSSPAEPPPIMVSSLAPNVGDTTSPVPQAPGYAPIQGLNESVSPENGSVSFGFQMPLPPGRQLTPGFSVSYNSAGAHYIASSSTTAANYVTENGVLASAGWSYSVPMLTFSASRVTPPGTEARCEVSSSYVYQSADGQRIPLQLTVAGFQWGADNASNACGSQYYPQVTEDHEGAWAARTQPDGTWWDYQPVTVFDPQGNTILFSGTAGFSNASVPQSITDRNGNTVNYTITTAGALTITDTLGRKITTNGFGQLTGDSISVPGMSNQFSVVWGNEFGSAVSNITSVGSSPCPTTTATMGSGKAVTSITGPQGTYTFSYDATFGLVDKITYPNGGYVRYVWGTNAESDEAQLTQFQNGAYSTCTARVDTPAITDRYLSADGTTETEHQHFTYSTAWDVNNPIVWDSKTTVVTTSDLVAGTSYTTTYTNTAGNLSAPTNAATFVGTEMPLAQNITRTDTSGNTLLNVTQTWQTDYPFQLADTQTALNGINTSETSYGYDTLARLTQQDDWGFPNGAKTRLREEDTTYASFAGGVNIMDRPLSIVIRDGGLNWASETDFGYDENTLTATSGIEQHTLITVPRANLTSLHRLLKSDGSSALVTTFAYDDTGQRLSTTDPAGNTTNYSYTDSFTTGTPPTPTNAYVTQVTDALGNTAKYSWNYAGGAMASSTDANTQQTSYTFDAWDRLDQTNAPDGGVTTYAYTPSTIETKRKIDANGDSSDQIQTVDGLDRASVAAHETSTGSWSRVDTCYNGLGLKSFASYPYSSSSNGGAPNCSAAGDSVTYDTLSRPTQVTHSDGTTILTSYTGNASETQDEGNGSVRVAKIGEQDGLGRLVSLCEVTSGVYGPGGTGSACGQDIAATGLLTTYRYDVLGELTSVSQGAETRSSSFDAASRLTQSITPETGTWNYVYDKDTNCSASSFPGDLVSRTDARGIHTCYQYDSDHDLTGKTYSDGTPSVTFTYGGATQLGIGNLVNTAGRLSSESTASNTGEVISYDTLGRPAVEYEITPNTWNASATFNFASGYDLAGDLTSFSYSKGDTATTAYNLAGEALSLSSAVNGTLISGVGYNAAGEETAATLGNGTSETRGYDARLRPNAITSGGYSFGVTSYTPDSGILTSTDSVNGGFTYTMDSLNRIASASCTSGGCSGDSATYNIDRYGNRWSVTGTLPGAAPPTLTFNNAHNQVDGWSYDANGNLLSDTVHTYEYDAENRLISVDNGTTATYVYGAGSQRVRENVGGQVEEFVYGAGPQDLTVVDGNQNPIETDYGFDGRNLATVNSGGSYFAGSDLLGTVRDRANSSGASIETGINWPYGGFRNYSNSISRIHYTDQFEDTESGLDYFGFRYYNTALGRFMTSDPAGMAVADPSDPQSWNQYAYVENQPTTSVDPTGLLGLSDVLGGGAEAGISLANPIVGFATGVAWALSGLFRSSALTCTPKAEPV